MGRKYLFQPHVKVHKNKYCVSATLREIGAFREKDIKLLRAVRKHEVGKSCHFLDDWYEWYDYDTGNALSDKIADLLDECVRQYEARKMMEGAFDD